MPLPPLPRWDLDRGSCPGPVERRLAGPCPRPPALSPLPRQLPCRADRALDALRRLERRFAARLLFSSSPPDVLDAGAASPRAIVGPRRNASSTPPLPAVAFALHRASPATRVRNPTDLLPLRCAHRCSRLDHAQRVRPCTAAFLGARSLRSSAAPRPRLTLAAAGPAPHPRAAAFAGVRHLPAPRPPFRPASPTTALSLAGALLRPGRCPGPTGLRRLHAPDPLGLCPAPGARYAPWAYDKRAPCPERL